MRSFRGSWWLHVDLDVLDADQLPAVDYPQPGGLSWGELDVITAAALTSPGCVGWSVCIYNPDLDPDRSGAGHILDYLGGALAGRERARDTATPAPRRSHELGLPRDHDRR